MSDCKALKCYECGVSFALSNDIYQRRISDKKTFYCPNGHGQVFVGKTDAELVVELKEKVNNLENLVSDWHDRHQQLWEENRRLRLSVGAYKGVITKLKKVKL